MTPVISAGFQGTIVPLVTPFDEDERFDAEAMGRFIDFVIDQGADAVMPTALTGEGPLLDLDETLAVWDAVFEKVDGGVPVIPAVISTATARATVMVRAAEQNGAAAVMVAPIVPELYAGRSHDDVYGFYADVAAATPLPIVLFNYPSLTSVDYTAELLERLIEIDAVRFIKESTGDAKRVHQIMRSLGDRLTVICGAPNTALESLALGCRAWITGIMCAVPRSARQLVHAVVDAADLELARRIYFTRILPLVDVLSRNNNPTGTIKAAIRARGADVGVPRRPGSDVSTAERAHLERLMAEIAQAEERSGTDP